MSNREQLEQAIAALEAQRDSLGAAVVEAAVGALREKVAALDTAVAQVEQRKLVTILFSDLAGFTQMVEGLDPEDAREIMNIYFAAVTPVIRGHGGMIEKFMGDAILAVFGLPEAGEQDAENAVRAALAMQQALAGLNQQFRVEERPLRFQMRIGLNSGPVIASYLGGKRERDFTIVGDAVNTASRLQAAAPLGGILMAHTTYRQVRGLFEVVVQPPLVVKGKNEPLQTYLVQGGRPRAFRLPTRGVEGLETQMVGRAAELQRLQQLFAGVASGGPLRLVTVVAEPGLGKSRLLYELQGWLDVQPQPFYLWRGRTDAPWQKTPFALLRDLFARRFDIQENDNQAMARSKLEAGLKEWWLLPPAELAKHVPFIGHLLGFDYSQHPRVRPLLDSVAALYDQGRYGLLRFFLALAGRRPVVLLLEDIHWADDSSLAVLAYLMEQAAAAPLLVVAASRPSLYERRPDWARLGEQLRLQPLSPSDGRLLAADILRQAVDIPESLLELIIGRAEGNPFYLEEFIKMLIDDGIILTGAEKWQVNLAAWQQLRIPPTLAGILQARLDSLGQGEKRAMQQAAVAGRLFWDDLLAHLRQIESSMGELTTLLNHLEQRELIFQQAPSAFAGMVQYRFKHSLLRDVAYDTVLKADRRHYHSQTAAWLVERSGERAEEYAALIADHWQQAGQVAQAIQWYSRAGWHGLDSFAYLAALEAFEQAAALLPQLSQPLSLADTARFYTGLGQARQHQARPQEAEVAYELALAAAETAGDVQQQFTIYDGLVRVWQASNQLQSGLARMEPVVRLARQTGHSPAWQAQAIWSYGTLLYRAGRLEEAYTLFQESLALALAAQAQPQIASSYNTLGGTLWLWGRYRQAQEYMERSLAIWQSLGHRVFEAALLGNLGEIARQRGNYETALAYYDQAIQCHQETAAHDHALSVLANKGATLVHQERYPEALAILQQVASMEAHQSLAWAQAMSALAYAALGQGEAALEQAQRAVSSDLPEYRGAAWLGLAAAAAALDRPVAPTVNSPQRLTARHCFLEAAAVFQAHQMSGDLGRAYWARARYEREQGDEAAALALALQAHSLSTTLEATGLAAEIAADFDLAQED